MAIDIEKIKERKSSLDDQKANIKKKRARREYYKIRNQKTRRTMNGEYHIVKKEDKVNRAREQDKIEKFLQEKKEVPSQNAKNRKEARKSKKKNKKVKYEKYITSAKWRKRRKLLLEAIGEACEICHANHSLHAHHNNYKTRGDEQNGDLTVLCNECHDMFHKASKVASGRNIKPLSSRCNICAHKPHLIVAKAPRDIMLCESCFSIYFKKLRKHDNRRRTLKQESFLLKFLP
jgi:hypothetical protein